jgi:hypothetical protein
VLTLRGEMLPILVVISRKLDVRASRLRSLSLSCFYSYFGCILPLLLMWDFI